MRLYQYFPDHDRALSVNQTITVKETTVSPGWKYMIQKSSDRINWIAHTTPLTPAADNSATYKITSDLAGYYIRFVIGGSVIPISANYTQTGESLSPVYHVLTSTSADDSIFSDIEVRSADNMLISKNDHGEITYPVLHLNREPVRDDFQDFENVLAIINRPTYFTFDPAPLAFTSANGFSQFAYISSNARWMIKSIPSYIQIVREGRQITAGNGTLSFNIHVDTSNLAPGIYNEYIVFENLASGEEMHVPLMIDVDVPLTVNEESEVVNIVLYRDADSQHDSEELRVVRDRYWQFANFEPLEQYFEIGRKDGSHNAATILSLKEDYSNTSESTYTFFCISNNYIVRINVTVRISAYCQLYPRSFLFYPGQETGCNTTPAVYESDSGFEIDADGNHTQILTVRRFNHKLVTLPAAVGNPTWLKIEEITSNLHTTMAPVVDKFRVTFNSSNANKQHYAGIFSTTLNFQYTLGNTTNVASNVNATCYVNIPRMFLVETVNENPIPSENSKNGEYRRSVDLLGNKFETSGITPYLYTTRQEFASKTTAILDVKANLPNSPGHPGVSLSTASLSQNTSPYTDSSNTRIRGARVTFTTPESWTSLRNTVDCTVQINAVTQYSTAWNNTSEVTSPRTNTTTFPAITIRFPIEARRQHFLRGNDLGTLVPDFNYRRLGQRFTHNPNCTIAANSATLDIELILHSFSTSGAGYSLTPTRLSATHVGAQFTPHDTSQGYIEYGRNEETALTLTSRVLTKAEASALGAGYVGYDDHEFIGSRTLTASLSALVFHGYDDDNMIPIRSAIERFTCRNIDTPADFNTPISLHGAFYDGIDYNAAQLPYSVKFNTTDFTNREQKPYLLYEFDRNRMIRGLAFHLPPKFYNDTSHSATYATYFIETRVRHNDGTFGNWQALMVTSTEALQSKNTVAFRTCVPRLAAQVRIFKKYSHNQLSYQRYKLRPEDAEYDGIHTYLYRWQFGVPQFHFYENTPLFYTSTAEDTLLGSNVDQGYDYGTGVYTYPGTSRSLPFFNSYIGFLLYGNPSSSEQKNWYDLANGFISHENPTKTSSTYFSGYCQNYYRYNLVTQLDLSAPTPRTIAGRNPQDNYVKLVPVRRKNMFGTYSARGTHSDITATSPIRLTGAILYSPENSNIPFAGCMLLQSSSDDTSWTFSGNTADELETAYELSGSTYSPFAVFSVGNYFGAIQLRDAITDTVSGQQTIIDHKTTTYLLHSSNKHILDEFAREVSNLLPHTPGKPITVLNDHPNQGSLLRGTPLPTTPVEWEWKNFGATLYLTSWSNVAAIYNETALKNDTSHQNKNEILRRWVEELDASGRAYSAIIEALGEVAIYAPANNIDIGITPNFKRYKYDNNHSSTNSKGLPAVYDGTWTDLTRTGSSDSPFYYEIEKFYHQTLPLTPVKYLSLSCGGLINIFNNVNNALQYGEFQLFHRFTGIEVFFDNLPETPFRRSQLYNGANRYYHDSATFDPAGWQYAEDWTDGYCGTVQQYTPTNPRTTLNQTMRVQHTFQSETNGNSTFSNTSGNLRFYQSSYPAWTQSNTLCAELSTSFTFGVPFFTYCYIVE